MQISDECRKLIKVARKRGGNSLKIHRNGLKSCSNGLRSYSNGLKSTVRPLTCILRGYLKSENDHQRRQVMIARTNINANETPVPRNPMPVRRWALNGIEMSNLERKGIENETFE